MKPATTLPIPDAYRHGIMPYVCPACGGTMARDGRLPYLCYQCGAGMVRRDSLGKNAVPPEDAEPTSCPRVALRIATRLANDTGSYFNHDAQVMAWAKMVEEELNQCTT